MGNNDRAKHAVYAAEWTGTRTGDSEIYLRSPCTRAETYIDAPTLARALARHRQHVRREWTRLICSDNTAASRPSRAWCAWSRSPPNLLAALRPISALCAVRARCRAADAAAVLRTAMGTAQKTITHAHVIVRCPLRSAPVGLWRTRSWCECVRIRNWCTANAATLPSSRVRAR